MFEDDPAGGPKTLHPTQPTPPSAKPPGPPAQPPTKPPEQPPPTKQPVASPPVATPSATDTRRSLSSHKMHGPDDRLPKNHSTKKRRVYPFDPNLIVGHVDAGVDSALRHVGPIFAIGDSIVVKVDEPGPGGQWRGLGAVYFKLKTPITINGTTYTEWYTAEAGKYSAKLKPGVTVHAGEQVATTTSGWQETGFFAGQNMSGEKPTQPGHDFRDWLLSINPKMKYVRSA